MTERKEIMDYEAELIRGYEYWKYIKEHGGCDLFCDDSDSLNLARKHIIYVKKCVEEKYGKDLDKYPEAYFRELPPETAGVRFEKEQGDSSCLS